MQERGKIGDIPLEVMNALAAIRDGKDDPELRLVLNNWSEDNEFRINYIDAELELERDDSGSRHTSAITPTDKGTGLSRQGIKPRDLRVSE